MTAKIDLDDIADLVTTFQKKLESQSERISKLRTRISKQEETICKLDGGHDFKDYQDWEDHWVGFEFVPAAIRSRCADCGAEKIV